MTENPTILLAEDNPADVFLVREAIRTHELMVHLHVVHDGAAAIQYIDEVEEDAASQQCPQLALLDLNLPKRSGLEVLERLRRSVKCGDIPVAIFSSSRSLQESDNATELRANCFFTKPNDFDQYMRLGGILRDLLREGRQERRLSSGG
jgi:CheY-like chemotaxis protein